MAIENVETALVETGSGLDDVVRTRLFVTDIDDWEAVGRAHGEAFDVSLRYSSSPFPSSPARTDAAPAPSA